MIGIAQKIAHSNKPNVRISDCLECSSSALQESEVNKTGKYPVYGANGIVGYIDKYYTQVSIRGSTCVDKVWLQLASV